MAKLRLKHVADNYNCYSEFVRRESTFLLLLYILEVQWVFHAIKT